MSNQFEPGSRENPLPVPEDILSGKGGWLTKEYDNGLVYCIEDHRYYQYPQSVVDAQKKHIETLRSLKATIMDFHIAYESMQIDPKNRERYERYITAKEQLAILIREHWAILIGVLKIDV
jgi:hypothetical protein